LDSNEIRTLVEQYFAESGKTDCFFVDAKIVGKKIEVFLDRDGGISFDVCHRVSRILEEVFDSKLTFGESYTLDVSSPGVGSPLKLPRQYKNNIGRAIEIKLSESKIKGNLIDASDDRCIVEEETVVKEGNKKKIVMVAHELPYTDIIEAKIKINF
jgi:ribosome maturation factor RimP